LTNSDKEAVRNQQKARKLGGEEARRLKVKGARRKGGGDKSNIFVKLQGPQFPRVDLDIQSKVLSYVKAEVAFGHVTLGGLETILLCGQIIQACNTLLK